MKRKFKVGDEAEVAFQSADCREKGYDVGTKGRIIECVAGGYGFRPNGRGRTVIWMPSKHLKKVDEELKVVALTCGVQEEPEPSKEEPHKFKFGDIVEILPISEKDIDKHGLMGYEEYIGTKGIIDKVDETNIPLRVIFKDNYFWLPLKAIKFIRNAFDEPIVSISSHHIDVKQDTDGKQVLINISFNVK